MSPMLHKVAEPKVADAVKEVNVKDELSRDSRDDDDDELMVVPPPVHAPSRTSADSESKEEKGGEDEI